MGISTEWEKIDWQNQLRHGILWEETREKADKKLLGQEEFVE